MRSDRYFLTPGLDALLMGGGSLVVLALLTLTGWDPKGLQFAVAAAWLAWVVNWPHFAATLERLARSPDSRTEFPLTVYLVPVLVLVGMAASFASPEGFAPFFIKFYLLWSPYHFSGQTTGVTLIYARRNGITLGLWGRRWLSLFVFGTFVYSALEVEAYAHGAGYYGIAYPGFGVPSWASRAALVAACSAGLAFLLLFLREARGKGPATAMVLVPLLAQFAWFVLAKKNLAFFALVPFFHSLQYLPVAWAMGVADRKAAGEIGPSTWKRESLYWYGSVLMGGVALFHLLPKLVSLTGLRLDLATGVVLAGVQLHHFFVDGVVWKLKSSRVGNALTRNFRNVVEG